jgi:hypothetical protein
MPFSAALLACVSPLLQHWRCALVRPLIKLGVGSGLLCARAGSGPRLGDIPAVPAHCTAAAPAECPRSDARTAALRGASRADAQAGPVRALLA